MDVQGAVKEGRGKREEESHDDIHVFIVGTNLDDVRARDAVLARSWESDWESDAMHACGLGGL